VQGDDLHGGAYGVFSVPSDTYDGDSIKAQETLYNVLDDELQAAVWMGRFIVFRAFHLIPYEDFHKLVNGLTRMVEGKKFRNVVQCAGVTYYIRELTITELRDIALENPLVEPPAV